jgi:hypothetical protein
MSERASSPAPRTLAFATSCFQNYAQIKNKNTLTKNVLDDVIRVIKGRITLEREYSKGLAKLSTPLVKTTPTLDEAIVGFR